MWVWYGIYGVYGRGVGVTFDASIPMSNAWFPSECYWMIPGTYAEMMRDYE